MKWDYSVREFYHVSRDTMAKRKPEPLVRLVPVYHVFRGIPRYIGEENRKIGRGSRRRWSIVLERWKKIGSRRGSRSSPPVRGVGT